MADEATMLAAPAKYLQAFSNQDVDGIVALYADDAIVEDPVGSDKHVGKEAIRAFYAGAVAAGVEAQLSGEVRLAANEVAFPFTVKISAANMEMRIIDTFRFNAAGEVVEMRAFWGPSNGHTTS